jgi:chemotaxis protein MotB
MAGLLLIFILMLTLSLLDYRNEMKVKEQQLAKTQQEVEAYKEALAAKEQKIQEVLGIKADIIRALTKEFEGSNIRMEIDQQTGAIRFEGGVFFDLNSDEVSENGYAVLNDFIPTYIAILLSDTFRNYIAQIIVEGHTDQQGSYIYNLELSQRRALSVVKAILSPKVKDFGYKKEMESYITANGRSFSQLIYTNGKVDPEKSRRVEFQFRLKDDEMIRELERLVKVE